MNLFLLFASQPLNGQVLPGLVPPFHPFQAALLYHAMLRDQLRILAEIPDSKARICFEQGLLPGSFEGDLQWELQRGGTLPERLSYAFQSAFESGPSKVLAMGFDSYLQGPETLREALEGLDSASVVIAPGLVGFKRYLPSMLKVEPHKYRGLAVALSLKYRMPKPGLDMESRENADFAPLCATTLAAIS